MFIESPVFPDSISEGFVGGPVFRTYVFETWQGNEQRSATWSRAKHSYSAGFSIRTSDDMDVLRSFIREMKGRRNGFRFRDPIDYQLSSELIGTGNGATAIYQIIKTYTVGSQTYVRKIMKPVSALVVTVNAVVKTAGVDYNIDYTTGIITFTSSVTNTHAIRVTGEFDVPVRFDNDVMAATHDGYLSESWGGVKLIELSDTQAVEA